MSRKFYRAVFKYEVLSEDPIEDMSLGDIDYECREGQCSGQFLGVTRQTVGGKKMAKLLMNQGSSPDFFRLDDEGNDLDEDRG